MQWKQVASVIAKAEGKKSQVKIGDVREILAALVDLQAMCMKNEESGPADLILSRASAVKIKGKKK